jgi:hypothetical protein
MAFGVDLESFKKKTPNAISSIIGAQAGLSPVEGVNKPIGALAGTQAGVSPSIEGTSTPTAISGTSTLLKPTMETQEKPKAIGSDPTSTDPFPVHKLHTQLQIPEDTLEFPRGPKATDTKVSMVPTEGVTKPTATKTQVTPPDTIQQQNVEIARGGEKQSANFETWRL